MTEHFRYQEIATELNQHIDTGLYKAGDRLPGIRRLAQQFNASISTIQEALYRLEEQGKVSARPRSGFFVNAPRTRLEPTIAKPPREPLPVSGPALGLKLVQAANNPNMIQLGAAVPHSSFLPHKIIARAMATAHREHAEAAVNYSFPPGNPYLRQQLARRLATLGMSIHPDELVITTGCHESVTLALRAVTKPGDVVAVESPTYYGLHQSLDAVGLKALEIPTDSREGISLEALSFALDQWPVKACIVTTNFSNPLGCVLSTEKKKALVELLENQEIPLIEDDIYGDLNHTGQRPDTAKTYDTSGNVIYCSSFSKTLAPGMRVGWVAPGRHYGRVEYLKYVSNLATPSAEQIAIATLLEKGSYDRHLRDIRTAYARSVARMLQTIETHFPQGTRVTRPNGGLVIWVQLPKGADSMNLYEKALSEGISIAPGPMFSVSGKYKDCLRLSTALPWTPELERALVRLGQMAAG